MSEQADLGFNKVEGVKGAIVSLDKIVDPDYSDGTNKAAHSIEQLGFLSTVLLQDRGDETYEILDGRRRVQTARKENRGEVPALVIPEGVEPSLQAILPAVMNLARSESPLVEAESIAGAIEAGYSEDSLSALGIPKQTIRKRMRLWNAPEEIKEGVRKGDIAPTTAEKVSKLMPTLQKQAVDAYEANGNLTGSDVKELRQAKVQEDVDRMSSDLFDGGEEEAGEESSDHDEAEPEEEGEEDKGLAQLYSAASMCLLKGADRAELEETIDEAIMNFEV